MNTSILSRIAAALAAGCTTVALFSAVLSLADQPPQEAGISLASATPH